MIPLQDLNPRRRPALVTWGLIIVNVCVFLFELSLSGRLARVFFVTGDLPLVFF